MTKNNAIELINLTKKYRNQLFADSVCSIENLNLGFSSNKITGFLGHNGAGKTTTIRTLLGLTKKTSGNVLIFGKAINRQNIRKIGYLAERNKFPQNLSPMEIMHFHNRLLGADKEKADIEARLKELGLWTHRKKRIRQLSKGLSQRLAWGIATLHNPEIIILDEPFSGLDPLGRSQVKLWLLQQKSKGKTVILCTHEIEQADAICDEIVILKKGKVVLDTAKKPRRTFWELGVESIDKSIDKSIFSTAHQLESNENITKASFISHQDAERALHRLFEKKAHINFFRETQENINHYFGQEDA